jgi:hypothetical protein
MRTTPGRSAFRGWRIGIAAAGLIVALTIGLWLQPVVGAYLCPRCYGFERMSGRIYVDAAMPAATRARLADAIAEGEQKVAQSYGGLRRAPVVLACSSDACDRRIGGRGARAVAYGTEFLRLAPLGIDPVIITHERSHIEFHAMLGLQHMILNSVPAWFDEGLAVIVADDPRYLLPQAAETDRCRQRPDGPLPSNGRDWGREAGRDQQLYARAACRVLRWMNANNGMSGVLALVNRLKAGDSFEVIFGSP